MTEQADEVEDGIHKGTGPHNKDEHVKTADVEPEGRVGQKLRAGLSSGGESAAALPVLTPEQKSLVAANIGLVGLHMRNRVPTPRQPTRQREYEDLFQEGCVALARAAFTYHANQHGPFAAYALPRIRGAIHAALHEYFATIRVPTRVCKRAQQDPGNNHHLTVSGVQELSSDVVRHLAAARPTEDHGETIRHAIHRRYERAVKLALADLQTRSWRQRNPLPIMRRLAAERLLISQEGERTPLRQIARECGVSSGRVSAYERQLADTVRAYFADDPQLPLLITFACEDAQCYSGVVDDQRRHLLAQAELDAFVQRFSRLDRPQQAELVYDLIERSAAAVGEVACNLYRLTITHDPGAIPAVA